MSGFVTAGQCAGRHKSRRVLQMGVETVDDSQHATSLGVKP